MIWIIVLCAGILIYSLTVAVFEHAGRQADTVRRRLDSIGNNAQKSYIADEEMSKPISERLFKPMLKSLGERLSRIRSPGTNAGGANAGGTARNRQEDKLDTMLIQAGFTLNAAEYNAIRLLVIGGTTLLFALLAAALKAGSVRMFLAALFGFFMSYTVMRYHLTLTITQRRRQIEQQLPDVLDLLSISVEAGLGFEQAISHIIANIKGPLIDELTVTYREMSMGRTRRDALILLGERCGVEEIQTFVSALVQAGQLGIPMKNVLQSQADAMRQARKAKIQEKAMKVSVKILIPMLLFIFPVIFIVLLGPAAVRIMQALG